MTSLKQKQPATRNQLFVWKNPGRVIDRNGYPVLTTGNVWQLHDPSNNVNINWDGLVTARDIKDAIRCYEANIIETFAAATAYQVFNQIKHCFRGLPQFNSAHEITYEQIEAAIANARVKCQDWHFHYIRKWYAWCHDQGVPGFSSEIATRLYKLRITNNPHGVKVMSRDINDGPLSNDEHFLVRQAVKSKRGKLVDRVIIMLLLETGSRPAQLVRLEEQDFITHSSPSNGSFFSLNVPGAKKRHIRQPPKKRRRISPELAKDIKELISQNHEQYGNQGERMPILCTKKLNRKKLTQELSNTFKFHMKVIGLRHRLHAYSASAAVVSPRTEKYLTLHALRLRYSYFTRLAEQGAAANHLAELADHSNDKSIPIYVASTNNVVDRLNAALGKDLHYSATLSRFLGKVTAREENSDPGAIVYGSTPTLKNIGGVGVCGANFLCDLYPPLSCYVCPKFQAWIDGPHAQLLKELERFVTDLVARSSNPSDRIPHQLADVITSLRQLLTRISEINRGKKSSSN